MKKQVFIRPPQGLNGKKVMVTYDPDVCSSPAGAKSSTVQEGLLHGLFIRPP